MTLFLTILAGALLAGFVHGLVGFGTGLVVLGIWLHVIEPATAAPLVVICSVVSSLQSLHVVRRGIDLRRLWPFVLFGLLGVPIGVMALESIEATMLRLSVGIFLILYSAAFLMLRSLPVVRRGGRAADGLIGFGGGILGGAAGLSGPLPTVWCGLRGWSKDEQRAILQPFNMIILGWALIAYAYQGVLTEEIGWLATGCLPGTMLGVWLGIRTYGRVDDKQFRRIVLWLLLASGGVLIATNLL